MRTKLLWTAGAAPGVLLFAAAAYSGITFNGSAKYLFGFTVTITVTCAFLAFYLLAVARENNLGELGLFAAGLVVVSLLPLVHGLTVPGIIYESNSASAIGAWGGLPLAILIASPVLSPKSAATTWALVHWRGYSNMTIGAVIVICASLLSFPNALPAPGPGQWWTLLGATFGLSGSLAMGARHINLYEIGKRRASYVAALGLSYIGLSSLVWLVNDPLGLASWLAHGFDGFGVLLACWGLLIAYRSEVSVAEIFAPVLNSDPKMALRLGVSPVVEQFLTDLDNKDEQTRGHVVRVAELAMSLGQRAGVGGRELRNLGLAAILHDIGKLKVPDAILKKKGRLTDSEYEQIKLHTIWGEELLSRDVELIEVGSLVRSHHERIDGKGYPDGLSGKEIPTAVQIISVCDAWDAIVKDRHYRDAIDVGRAQQIMREHSGTQWDTVAVGLLLAEIESRPQGTGTFEDLGAGGECQVCQDALPVNV